MNDFQGFPTFQFSFFPQGRDGEQIVVRGNDFQQFVLDIEEVKKEFVNKSQDYAEPEQQINTIKTKSPETTKVCSSCGSAMEHKTGTSKAGNDYNGWFCVAKCGADPIWIKD